MGVRRYKKEQLTEFQYNILCFISPCPLLHDPGPFLTTLYLSVPSPYYIIVTNNPERGSIANIGARSDGNGIITMAMVSGLMLGMTKKRNNEKY